MLEISARINHYANIRASLDLPYNAKLRRIASLEEAARAYHEICCWPNYRPTPLHQLDRLAGEIGVKTIWYKDESHRFGLKSFKALGGAYAVARQLRHKIAATIGVDTSVDDLIDGKYREITEQVTISCATDGNHGRSVAWGCQVFGCDCAIYLHRDVSTGRQQAIEVYGAKVYRVDGNYDDSVKRAASDAQVHGRIVVSDTSYAGYTEIPRDVALGYSVMLAEAIEQMENSIPSHVFIQGGVGGLAAAVCAYFWELWGSQRPRFIVVEPENANCLQQSARAGEPVTVDGDLETLMAGLSCGEVSLNAWQILSCGANDFLTLNEEAVAPCMRLLAANDPPIEAGESAVAGLGALIAAMQTATDRASLELDANSRVFVIGTEGATDAELYRRLTAG